jgi:hypothetical protein
MSGSRATPTPVPREVRGAGRQVGHAVRGAALLALLTGAGACGQGAPLPELGDPLVLASTGGSNPTTALDARAGVGYVTWVGTEGERSDVLLVRLEGESAAAPVRVNDIPGDAAPHLQAPPRVAVGPEGNVYVAWQNNTDVPGRMFPASDLRFARSTDGGRSFEAAVTVNEDVEGPPASHTFHDLIVTAAGDVVISWLDGRRGAAPGEAAHEGHSVGPDLRVAVSRDGGRSFAPSSVVALDTCPCCRTDLAAAPDGTLYVGWRHIFPGDVRDVVVARSRDGGASWEGPLRVHEDGWVFPGCPHAGPALAVGSDGALHVGWYTGKEGAAGLFYARSNDGGRTFSAPRALVGSDAVPPSQVELSVGADGRPWAAWEHRGPAGQWSLLSVDGPEPGSALRLPGTNPSLAAGEGGALLGWLAGDSVLAVWAGG